MIGGLRVSLRALHHNAEVLRRLVGPQRAAFVVKGNAYGHGLLETARAIEPLAARLCVYSVEEALALRSGGITAPILVMGPIPSEPRAWSLPFGVSMRSPSGSPGRQADAKPALSCT